MQVNLTNNPHQTCFTGTNSGLISKTASEIFKTGGEVLVETASGLKSAGSETPQILKLFPKSYLKPVTYLWKLFKRAIGKAN